MGQSQFPISTNKLILIQNSLFLSLHLTEPAQGGAIFIRNESIKIHFGNVGFYQCSTSRQYGGALLLDADSLNLTYVCAGECEATHTSYQFAYLKAVQASFLKQLTIRRSGYQNTGRTALAICGEAQFFIHQINSTDNYNQYGTNCNGCCFGTAGAGSFQIYYLNFCHSCGDDVLFMQFNDRSYQRASIYFGSVFNCTAKYLINFEGTSSMSSIYFFDNTISGAPFNFRGDNQSINSMTLEFCKSDVELYCAPQNSQNVTNFIASYDLASPGSPFLQGTFYNGLCHGELPSITSSFTFSSSNFFTNSIIFSSSGIFTNSIIFSSSDIFTPSQTKTITPVAPIESTPTSPFTPSNSFTPSFSFKPERTKIPDGVMNRQDAAEVYGDSMKPATKTQIGATTGVSVVIIVVAVVLMLLYLGNKRRELRKDPDDILVDSSSDSTDSDYSYSFYTTTYYYSSESNLKNESNRSHEADMNEEEDFQSFDPSDFDQDDIFAWQDSHTAD